jgi:hypothetical protein
MVVSGSGSCRIAGFGVTGVESSDSSIRELDLVSTLIIGIK